MTEKKTRERPPTLLDRAAIAVFSGLSALGLGSLIWFVLSWRIWMIGPLPFWPVVYVAGVVAILGFFLAENVVIAVIAGLLEALFGVMQL